MAMYIMGKKIIASIKMYNPNPRYCWFLSSDKENFVATVESNQNPPIIPNQSSFEPVMHRLCLRIIIMSLLATHTISKDILCSFYAH